MLAANQDGIVCVGSKIYIGTITFATANYMIIEAIDLKTSTSIETKFYKNEIKFIQPLKQCQGPSKEISCDFTLQDLLRVSEMMKNYVYIKRFDRTYHDAIADIELESFIGFHMPDVDRGRFSKSSLIVCSTSKSIYIFDIMVMGRIEKAIKSVLEANAPKKIIHDASKIADCLKHQFTINLAGVFDTMVAHCSLGFDKERIDLGQCLEEHFKLPEIFFDESIEWHRRPLSSNAKNVAAQNVIFLRKLHSHFSRIMLKNLYETSN